MKHRYEARRGARLHAAREAYVVAWRWRRAVESELRPLGLTFSQWFVLDATAQALHLEQDAVSQNQVAQNTELDRQTISQVMHTLDQLGLVSRAPDHTGRAYRIFLTTKGERTLQRANVLVETVPAVPSKND